MSGNSPSSARIAGSKVSTADAGGGREYLGGSDDANARPTAPRDTPSRRAIARADNPSDRCNRRISAQSSKASTPLTVKEWPCFQSATSAQFSVGSDSGGCSVMFSLDEYEDAGQVGLFVGNDEGWPRCLATRWPV